MKYFIKDLVLFMKWAGLHIKVTENIIFFLNSSTYIELLSELLRIPGTVIISLNQPKIYTHKCHKKNSIKCFTHYKLLL